MIEKIEGLDALITLEELDLYDNQLEKIENLEPLVNLKYKK
jgi:protein phosphatase 1 regulatory subunit 7